MRNQEKRSQSETQQTLLRPLKESSKILAAITAMALRLGKPMSGERMEQLLNDLAPYPVQAIEWAFDTWGKTAEKLPTLSNILKLLETWHGDHVEERCDCSHLHGRGYGWNDIKWLLKQRRTSAARWSISDWEGVFADLDKQREGGSPEWRKGPQGQNFLRIES